MAQGWRELGAPKLARRAAKRQCGSCAACCTVNSLTTFPKPQHVACPHLGERGCSIYRQRPEECRVFYCGWRAGFLPVDMRPDRSGVVVDMSTSSDVAGGVLLFTLRVAREGIDVRPVLDALARDLAFLNRGRFGVYLGVCWRWLEEGENIPYRNIGGADYARYREALDRNGGVTEPELPA